MRAHWPPRIDHRPGVLVPTEALHAQHVRPSQGASRSDYPRHSLPPSPLFRPLTRRTQEIQLQASRGPASDQQPTMQSSAQTKSKGQSSPTSGVVSKSAPGAQRVEPVGSSSPSKPLPSTRFNQYVPLRPPLNHYNSLVGLHPPLPPPPPAVTCTPCRPRKSALPMRIGRSQPPPDDDEDAGL